MSNKYSSNSKADLNRPSDQDASENQDDKPVTDSHSQDADRHRRAAHPKSEK